ncbi:MAG: GldG family protein [Planctomycetota bacterium]
MRPRDIRGRAQERGAALALSLHVLLVLLVLGQVVYLASRFRLRVDMTSDRLWTSTDSTREVLGKLDKRLLVEAYFSPKDDLPLNMRGTRDWADNFLDEITQLGKGRVVVQRFDPNSDKAVADKATRLGVQPLNLSSRSATSLSVDQHWQGLRLVYGGSKQEVIPSFLPTSSFVAEAVVTPKIKEVMVEQKRAFGFMEWPARSMERGAPAGVGWSACRGNEGLKKRYEFQNFKDEDGALLPDDLQTLFLFRPKDLTDRQKYVIDQFVVSGGTLVVFADAAEYAIGPRRLMRKMPLSVDAAGSEVAFVDMLRHYGVEWRPQLVCDMAPQAFQAAFNARQEYFSVPVRGRTGLQSFAPVNYPYFFHARNLDWATAADQLAKDPTGAVDERKAEQYRRTLQPGMPADDFLFQAFRKLQRGPGFYWPTWVGLARRAGGALDLPEGVDGRVLLWSSPLALVEDPPQVLNPIGQDPRQYAAVSEQFFRERAERLQAETRRQVPLMCEVRGRFGSFFAGRDRPLRPSEAAERDARGEGPPRDDVDDPPAAQAPPEEQGPQPAPPSAEAALPPERAMRTEAAAAGRIVMVGDATFLRDDLLSGAMQQQGGPVSAYGLVFFAQMLDWLSEDRDLIALQTRVPTDRTLKFVDEDVDSRQDPRDAEQALRSKTRALVAWNVALPSLLLAAFGAALWIVRRNQKRAFLTSLNG